MIAEIRIDEKENSFYCGEAFIEGMNAIICSDGRESGVHKSDENQNWFGMKEK
ncbi:hypothetical protein [Niallia circulans]|uniref:hypothetical protein n=1 Tax=Niallia circulans TaxID=1397 RepID=UPI0015C9F7CD|nr:hypothetical protein [Niallia circulans]